MIQPLPTQPLHLHCSVTQPIFTTLHVSVSPKLSPLLTRYFLDHSIMSKIFTWYRFFTLWYYTAISYTVNNILCVCVCLSLLSGNKNNLNVTLPWQHTGAAYQCWKTKEKRWFLNIVLLFFFRNFCTLNSMIYTLS